MVYFLLFWLSLLNVALCSERCANAGYCDQDCQDKLKEQEDDQYLLDLRIAKLGKMSNMAIRMQDYSCNKVLEIGAGFGMYTEHLLENMPSIEEYHAIDTFLNMETQGRAVSEEHVAVGNKHDQQMAEIFLEKFKKYGCKVKLHHGFSRELVNDFNNTSLDCLIIDGDVTYRGTIADLTTYAPKVREDGRIFIVDYLMARKGMILAVDQFVDNNQLHWEEIGHNDYVITAPTGKELKFDFDNWFDYGHSADKDA